jgi:hypothetical protein
MMHMFLANNREDLIARCQAKGSAGWRIGTERQPAQGVPLFLDQLMLTFQAVEEGRDFDELAISGAPEGDALALSGVGVSAAAPGASLLGLGYTVDQVVHGNGDLCRAITDLALVRDAHFTSGEFRTLNRCLDNAIADAVQEFFAQRDARVPNHHTDEANGRVGFPVHDLRDSLSTASEAVSALEFGSPSLNRATGAVLMRSHASLRCTL